jgi:hypothetical protein
MDAGMFRKELFEARGLLAAAGVSLERLVDLIDEDGVLVSRQGVWTRSMLEQVRPVALGNAGLSAMFNVLSQRAGIELNYSEILEYSERSDQNLRNDLRHLSRSTAELFGSKTWPFEARQGPVAASGRFEMVYRMDSTIAHWWREA